MARQKEKKTSTPGSVCNCASAPVWMTELFDGDGTSAQAQNARAHLKSCSSCERVWREWHRTRSLLRAIPTPVVPSSLMERVVLSCRLLPAQDAMAQTALENEIACEELARYINAPEAEYSRVAQSPPLACFFEDAPVPAGLKAQILQLTTEAEKNRARTPVLSLTSSMLVEHSAFVARQIRSGMAREWSLPRAGRLGFALAVPAMAAWIFMAAPQRDLTVVPSVTPQTPTIAATVSPQSLLPKIMEKTPVVKLPPKPGVVVASKPPVDSSSASPVQERAVMASMNSQAITQVTPQLLDFPASAPPSLLIPATAIKPKTPIKPVTIKANTTVPVPKRKKPMINMARTPQPRLLHASLSRRAQSLAQNLLSRLPDDDGGRQVSTVGNVELREAAPTLMASREFDETLASVGGLRDDRPEELGQVVDIYRASLIAQNSIDEYSDEDFDE